MAEPRRRRMSRSISLVLLTSLPGLAGCGGEKTVEVDEVTEEPPPSGPEQLVGGPFIGWWRATHPPVVVRKTVPKSTAASGGYHSGRHRVVFVPVGGRSSYMGGSYSRGPGPAHSGPVSRGGFGNTGHGAVGG